jgi:hypothetical protein
MILKPLFLRKREEKQFEHDLKLVDNTYCVIDGYLDTASRKCVEHEKNKSITSCGLGKSYDYILGFRKSE